GVGAGGDVVGGGRDGPPRGTRPRRRRRLLVGAVCAALLALVAGLLIGRPWEDDGSSSAGGRDKQGQQAEPGLRPGDRGEFHYVPGKKHRCDISRKDGALYATYSLSTEALLDTNSTSWEVVEAQCLLRHHGYDPGTVDGAYGPKTKSAAKRFQRSVDLAPDGIVGPDTWGALRR
ncbi:peptidoglycan-binding protein, partial [Streptomyces sp. NPDC059063]